MKTWLPTLLSELQSEYLKAEGFRKQARTFSRDRGAYWERFNFQGSIWNAVGTRWRFFVNVGVEFKDLPERTQWSFFPHTHWAGRLEQLVPESAPLWEYDQSTDRAAVKTSVARLLLAGSVVLQERSAMLREDYVGRHAQGLAPP